MSNHIARIEVYPSCDKDGSMDLDLPFMYSCADLDLWGYMNFEMLIIDIRNNLKAREKK